MNKMPKLKNHKKSDQKQRGMLLVGVLVISLTLVTIGVALMSFTSSQYRLTNNSTYAANSMAAAEAGVEMSLHQLNQNTSFSGYATEQTFVDNSVQGKTVYTVVVQNAATGNAKTITSTGKAYRFGTNKLVDTKKVKVTTVGTGSPGYSVHTGPGGLILGGSANITNADVYTNGYITMSGAARIGTSAQPQKVYVANQRCPTGTTPGATYPQVCTSAAGQPITLAYSTYIYGTVCATGQTSTGPNPSGNILPGNGGAGLQSGCVAPPVETPSYDRAAHLAAVTTTAASTNSAYTCGGTTNRTWPAKLKLTGNVSVGSSCTLNITGDVYITGNLSIAGASKVITANSVGATRPRILVDGTISIGGSAQALANSQGTGIQFISSKAAASCNPDCTTLTGNDLKNSQGVETVTIGGAGSLPGMIFQAQWGKVTLGGSGNVGSVIGQTVDLSGAGTVTFGTALSSGTTTWTISSYQRLF